MVNTALLMITITSLVFSGGDSAVPSFARFGAAHLPWQHVVVPVAVDSVGAVGSARLLWRTPARADSAEKLLDSVAFGLHGCSVMAL